MSHDKLENGAEVPPLPVGPAWFCVRAQPKHEHIAAAHLRRETALDVVLPRIRFKRPTQQGQKWVTEALFPGYLFARFDLGISLRQVHHTNGVSGVVHFGARWPTIPDGVIEALRLRVGGEDVFVVDVEVAPGDEVQVVSGPFRGLHAVIERVMPGKARVAVLMDFLGRQSSVLVDRKLLLIQKDGRTFGL